jgi:hypothetical protein
LLKIKNGINAIKPLRSNKGQATLEYALVLPFLIIIFLISLQLGYTIYLKNIIEQSARESCRAISTTNSNQEGIEAIDRLCPDAISKKIAIHIQPENSLQRKVGDELFVRLNLKDIFLFKLIKKTTGFEPEIRAESTMRMECN